MDWLTVCGWLAGPMAAALVMLGRSTSGPTVYRMRMMGRSSNGGATLQSWYMTAHLM